MSDRIKFDTTGGKFVTGANLTSLLAKKCRIVPNFRLRIMGNAKLCERQCQTLGKKPGVLGFTVPNFMRYDSRVVGNRSY